MTNKTMKRTIYIRTFSALFAIYLVLMCGFSVFLISQEKKQKGIELQGYTYQINNTIEEILKENMDQNNNHIINSPQLKSTLFKKAPTIYGYDTELAIYTGDFNLIFNTNDYWRCSFTAYSKGNKNYTEYGYLDATKWFNKKEVNKLKTYLNAAPDAKEIGDLNGYSLDIEGFWLDNEMIIPDKIYVTPFYIMNIDKDGNTSGSGTRREDLVYSSNYINTKGLPYYESASIEPTNTGNPDSEERIALRNMVLDKDRLKEAVNTLQLISSESITPVTYRYYLIMPYQNMVNADEDQDYSSASWTVVAQEVNLLDQCAVTLAFVWGSCFIAFFSAALILSRQTYKTYENRAELEAYRKETTEALAHDLKTPLTIISGYAQNLIENIHNEKREHYASNIQSNVTRMDTIIREMLELSKIESHDFQILEEVSLKEICEYLTNRYDLLCKEKSIQVILEGNAVIKTDNALIQRVIDNFFINALDHTPSGGIIHIRIEDNTLRFYNSGSAIPEEKIHEIWKPYKKADASRGNSKGTGLGLSIASTILEQYHFSYGARNEDDGVVFWFRFG